MSEWDKDAAKTVFEPTTTSMKIPTTSDEDTTSLLLLPSVAAQSDALPEQLQQQLHKKSKLAKSGNGSTSAAIRPPTAHRVSHNATITTAMDIFLMSQDSIFLKANGSQVCKYVGCNEQDA